MNMEKFSVFEAMWSLGQYGVKMVDCKLIMGYI